MRPRIRTTLAAPMFLEPPRDIRRYAGIYSAVSAFKEVDVVHI